ncbi:carbohydrate sulfotransferase 5-like [Kryptolebias marmoratus]|uniref:Sulfotransferase n=1 Tax=Kryptolebias marmoratus TaxID=37003 RepID=A0A3Q3BBP0_KRYMA|nr:carbohydrate sulfotransferase 5-like [Kryptolebias marmoratus]XP_017289689.1 carbohydrate sulfotransferase 5-like [Kryptolebias marmoratus]
MGRYYRVTLKTVIFLVFLQGTAVVLFLSLHIQLSPSESVPQRKVHVLLLSSWRSGSSFLGQVFSQHPSVFYLMEPAWHVWTKVEKPGAGLLRKAVRDLLRGVFQCDFSVMDPYLPENYNMSSLFMWTQSRALCSPPACPLTVSNASQCEDICDARGLHRAKKACWTYSHVVLKEVRLFELKSLYPLLRDPNLDLRIIHLVRDPRAVFRSRQASPRALGLDSSIVLEQKKIPLYQMQYQVLEEVCRSHVRINNGAVVNPPLFLKDRYKMIRYEDLTRNPLKEINDLYEFAGLKMTPEMAEWIYEKTHGTGKGSKKQAFEITSRNATLVSQAWRTMLPFYKVKRVQDVCSEAMELLGYRTVNSIKEQKALDIDLLEPKEPYKFIWMPDKNKQTDLK